MKSPDRKYHTMHCSSVFGEPGSSPVRAVSPFSLEATVSPVLYSVLSIYLQVSIADKTPSTKNNLGRKAFVSVYSL